MSRKLLVLLLCVIVSSPVLAAAEHPAFTLVKQTTDKIIEEIKKQKSAIEADNSVLHKLVNAIVLPHFDFRKMSSWVLGLNWRKASDSQKQRFTDEFSRLLVRTYSRALYDNVDQKIDIQPVRGKPKDDDVTVHTEVEQKGGFPIPIDYKMHFKNGEWKVYDVVIDDISLVANYRTSFNQKIKTSGIDSLIASIAEGRIKPDDDKSKSKK